MTFSNVAKVEAAADPRRHNGEASTQLPIEIQEQYKDIPWSMMKGIRNVVAHEYFGIDLEIVWKTVKEDLPVLKKLLGK